jgi:hypothetical protein
VLGKVDHQRLADGLAGEAGAAAAREDRDTKFVRGLQRGEHILLILGHADRDGGDLIAAGVGGVDAERALVEVDLALHATAQGALETGDADERDRFDGFGHAIPRLKDLVYQD